MSDERGKIKDQPAVAHSCLDRELTNRRDRGTIYARSAGGLEMPRLVVPRCPLTAIAMRDTAQRLYFEDVQVGDQWRSPRRTVTEADIVIFAGVTGDYNPLHIDH